MNTEQKLKAIREKCAERIAYAESNATDLYGGDAIAGWESKEIISAWEGLA